LPSAYLRFLIWSRPYSSSPLPFCHSHESATAFSARSSYFCFSFHRFLRPFPPHKKKNRLILSLLPFPARSPHASPSESGTQRPPLAFTDPRFSRKTCPWRASAVALNFIEWEAAYFYLCSGWSMASFASFGIWRAKLAPPPFRPRFFSSFVTLSLLSLGSLPRISLGCRNPLGHVLFGPFRAPPVSTLTPPFCRVPILPRLVYSFGNSESPRTRGVVLSSWRFLVQLSSYSIVLGTAFVFNWEMSRPHFPPNVKFFRPLRRYSFFFGT